MFRIKKSEKERKKVSFRIKKSKKAIFLFARQTDGRGKGHIFHSFWSLQKKKNFLPQKSKKKKENLWTNEKKWPFHREVFNFHLSFRPKKIISTHFHFFIFNLRINVACVRFKHGFIVAKTEEAFFITKERKRQILWKELQNIRLCRRTRKID